MNIAVLLGGLIYDSQKSLLRGIREYAEKENINIFVFTCGGDIYTVNEHNIGEFKIYNLPNFENYDGVIIAPNTIQNADVVEQLEIRLSECNVPTISIDSFMRNASNYEADNEQALYEMTEHIVKFHGKKKICYISGPNENMESVHRTKGFLRCMSECGLKANQDYHVYQGDFWMESAKVAMDSYLKEHGAPEAVICANDYMAIGAIETLNANGFEVPEDVLVTGFDNSIDAKYHVPRITSIKKPMHDIGFAACKALAEGKVEAENLRFKVHLKFSESCGCNSGKRENIREFKRQVAKEKGDNIKWAKILSAMSSDLNELDTLDEFLLRLQQYIVDLKFPYFYLCLCEGHHLNGELELVDGVYREPDAIVTDYTDNVEVAIAYEDGVFYPSETIETKDLLPERFGMQAEGVMSVVVPIHFNQHCMGYCIVGNSDFPTETIQFQSWISSIGTGLEHIRKQMLMQSMVEQLNRMWIYDTMTGILNRAGFYVKADELLKKWRKEGKAVLLIFVDADKLKAVNDNFGHEEGDSYIKNIAKVCQDNCGEEGITMRYGGDEFVVLRWHDEYEDDPKDIIQKMEKEVADMTESENKPYAMSISAGHYISEIDDDFKLEVLIDQADREMYHMKRKEL